MCGQDKQPNNTEVQAEWAEVNQLQQEQLAVQIGLPGLCIEQLHGGCWPMSSIAQLSIWHHVQADADTM